MNENAKLWVQTLRSGKYEQGQYYLRRGRKGVEEFCCLGVACELAAEAGVLAPAHVRETSENGTVVYAYNGTDPDRRLSDSWTGYVATGSLPLEVMKWLDIATTSGDYEDGDDYEALSRDNDSGKFTFADIANIIEANADTIFGYKEEEQA